MRDMLRRVATKREGVGEEEGSYRDALVIKGRKEDGCKSLGEGLHW